MFKAHASLTLASATLAFGSWSDSSLAQVVPDTTLPNNSAINSTTSPATQAVTGGTRVGNNLFHSFAQFSIGANEVVRFDNAADIDIIFSRVTGASPSQIEGTLETQASADFFLLNPNGFDFGPDAQLNVGGSFIATTASGVEFSDGSSFRAVSPQPTDLLSINIPIGLQFGSVPSNSPGTIRVNGPGHGLEIDPDTLAVVSVNPPLNRLEVNAGRTLAIVGGGVELSGGNVQAAGGRISIGSVGNAGETVGLARDALGWQFDYQAVTQLGDIRLDQAASAIATGTGGGQIQIAGNAIEILEGSAIIVNTTGALQTQGIDIDARSTVLISGAANDSSGSFAVFPSSIFTEVELDQIGDGGDIAIRTPILEVSDGAQISASTFGEGQGGSISIEAEQVRLQGGTPELGPSGIYLDIGDFFATGNAGNLELNTQQLSIEEGANIASNNFGLGNGGQLLINADQIDILGGDVDIGPSRIVAQVEESSGQGANIRLDAKQLNILDGGEISSSLFLAEGDGGNIELRVDDLTISGTSPAGGRSGIFSQVDLDSQGNAGDITIQARNVTLAQQGDINSSTFTSGNAGNIAITADQLRLTGAGVGSSITTSVETGATGNGGRLSLNVNDLVVQDGSQIAVATRGPGDAGTLEINANQSITLQGQNPNGRSGLFASALLDTGAGGDIQVQTQRLTLTDGATINASNFSSTGSTPPGQGPAGSINLRAEVVELLDESSITASTAVGDRGNITLTSNSLTLRRNSRIATDAQSTATGGNITINSDFIIAPRNENSDITANARQGEGGNVNITAQSLLGIAFRPQLTPRSDITASSEVGLDGTVVIDQLNGDPASGTVELPEALADPSDRITAGCPSQANARFVVSGRGGIPEDPGLGVEEQVLVRTNIATATLPLTHVPTNAPRPGPEAIAPEWSERGVYPDEPRTHSKTEARSMTSAPVEANGWQTSSTGRVQLLTTSEHSPQDFRPAHNCHHVAASPAV